MNARHYAALEAAIQTWADDACCEDGWPDLITGELTISHMAKAAANVIDACTESQTFAKREGFVREV